MTTTFDIRDLAAELSHDDTPLKLRLGVVSGLDVFNKIVQVKIGGSSTATNASYINYLPSVNDTVIVLENEQDYIVIGKPGTAVPAVFNVKTFGALGDGTTGDAAAINATINASSDGDIIYFPRCSAFYKVEALVKLKSNRLYMGADRSVTIKQANGANLPAVLVSADWYDNATVTGLPLEMCNMTVDANRANNTASHGILLMNYRCYIHDIEILNPPADGLRFTALNRNGTLISTTCIENHIERVKVNWTSTDGGTGFRIEDTSGSKVSDGFLLNCIVQNGTQGAIIDAGTGWLVAGNHMYGQLQGGIQVYKCWDTRVTDNYVENFGKSKTTGEYYNGIGVVVYGFPTVVTNNMTFSRSDGVNGTYRGIVIFAEASTTPDVLVSDNVIRGYDISGEVGLSLEYGTSAVMSLTLGNNLISHCPTKQYVQGTGIHFAKSVDLYAPSIKQSPEASDTEIILVRSSGAARIRYDNPSGGTDWYVQTDSDGILKIYDGTGTPIAEIKPIASCANGESVLKLYYKLPSGTALNRQVTVDASGFLKVATS